MILNIHHRLLLYVFQVLTMIFALYSLAEHFSRNIEKEAASEMTIVRSRSGWINRTIFEEWLKKLDEDLSQPALLLLDSSRAHSNIDIRDLEKGIPWNYLRIQRLPKNSTSVTQPLDAGVISVFKRAFLEMLGYETYYVRNFDNANCISNGRAWALIPYAWNRIKPSTLRNCFAKTPVLPMNMREELRGRRPTKDEQRPTLQYSPPQGYNIQMKTYFEHLIAKVNQENFLDFRIVENREELDSESLHQENQEDIEENDQGDKLVDGVGCDISSTHDGYGSSPIADVDFDATIQTLKYLAGDCDILTVDGLKQVRERAGQEVRKSMKTLARACAAFKNEYMDKQ